MALTSPKWIGPMDWWNHPGGARNWRPLLMILIVFISWDPLTYRGFPKIKKIAAILQTTFPNAFICLNLWLYWFKCQCIIGVNSNRNLSLTAIIGAYNSFSLNRRQAITWTNDDTIYASPNLNALLGLQMSSVFSLSLSLSLSISLSLSLYIYIYIYICLYTGLQFGHICYRRCISPIWHQAITMNYFQIHISTGSARKT